MPTNKVNGVDVFKWLKTQASVLPMFLSIFSFAGFFVWAVYAEPAVKKVVEDSTRPLIKDIKTNEKKIQEISFESKQQLYLLKKMAGKKAVDEMEEDTEIFKPEDYEGEH